MLFINRGRSKIYFDATQTGVHVYAPAFSKTSRSLFSTPLVPVLTSAIRSQQMLSRVSILLLSPPPLCFIFARALFSSLSIMPRQTGNHASHTHTHANSCIMAFCCCLNLSHLQHLRAATRLMFRRAQRRSGAPSRRRWRHMIHTTIFNPQPTIQSVSRLTRTASLCSSWFTFKTEPVLQTLPPKLTSSSQSRWEAPPT